jgi:hypothetical protein
LFFCFFYHQDEVIMRTPWKLVYWGVLVLWTASIAFALQLKTLLTPANYPVGSDPSFDICLAAFLFILCLFGMVLIWRGILDGQNQWVSRIRNLVNFATYMCVGLLVVVFASGALLFSANSAFIHGYRPLVIDEPRPDYSFPTFPTPYDPRPTPTDAPGAILLSGNILSTLDGLRVGNISLSLSPDGDTIEYILIYMYRGVCQVQQSGSFTAYAVDDSKLLVHGPIQIVDRDFYVAQSGAAIQGISGSSKSAHGSLYLTYTDSASSQSCSFGSFTWSVSPV